MVDETVIQRIQGASKNRTSNDAIQRIYKVRVNNHVKEVHNLEQNSIKLTNIISINLSS